jgi:thioredoxin-dependent peroxiredoxin
MAIVRYEKGTCRTAGELPAIGSRAPDFSLVDTKLHNVSLTNWSGLRKIINIFVSIDTEVGARSVIEFDRFAADIENIALLMVSYDLPFAHQRFFDQHQLRNVVGLSAIRHAGFGKNYGVLIMDGPLAGMFARAVVVLDENDTVVHQEHIEDIATEPDYAAAFRALGIGIGED